MRHAQKGILEVMKYSKSDFPLIYSHTVNNEMDILHSKQCSCLFCRQTYDARKINDWANDKNGVTALCPECGMDAVVGDASGFVLDHETLKALNLAYFGEDYMEKHPKAAQKYIERYQEGKITHKKENEALYLQYLSLLAVTSSSVDAAYRLGLIYQYGTPLTPKDPQAALSWFTSPALKNDGDALTHIGIMLERGELGKAAPALAYQHYAKAMALGYLYGLFHFSDCYRDGIYVKPDVEAASQMLSNNLPELYAAFSASLSLHSVPYMRASELGSTAYRMGRLFERGSAKIPANPIEAIHYYLLAQFAFSSLSSENLTPGDVIEESNDTNQRLKTLAEHQGNQRGEPRFDVDTFSDTVTLLPYDSDEGTYHLLAPCIFEFVDRDENAHTLTFDMITPRPLIVCDVGDLFISPIHGSIRWVFEDVSAVELGQEEDQKAPFDVIIGNSEDGFQLIDTRGKNAPHTVATIRFDPPKGNQDEADSEETEREVSEDENRKKA